MSTKSRGGATMTIFSALLFLFTLVVWLYFAAYSNSLHGSDAAGDAMAQGFAMGATGNIAINRGGSR
jgi:hypothetical protein